MSITNEQLQEYLDEISDDLDAGNLDEIYKNCDPRNEWLTDELYAIGIDPLDEIPGILNQIAEMERSLQPRQYDRFHGDCLDSLITDYGNSCYRYIYLYQFKHNPIFKCEKLEKKYSYYQNNDNDYYIALSDYWDIDEYKKEVDGE